MIATMKNGKWSTVSSGGNYSGEKDMGDFTNWRILTTDSNDILKGSQKTLSKRSATLFHTYGPVKSAVNGNTKYAIGPGLVFRSQPDFETLGISKEEAVIMGKKIQKIVHYYQDNFSLYEKQAVLFKTAMAVGDSLLLFERKDGLITDMVELSGNQIDSDCQKDNFTNGIKHDSLMRRKGYMSIDGTTVNFQDEAGNQNAIQFYIKELARQLRGYPLAYAIINLARNDDTHWDAITHRAVMEAVMMAVFKGDHTDFGKQTKNLAEANQKVKGGIANKVGAAFEKVQNALNLGSGNVYTIKAGEDLEFLDMKAPSDNFKDFKDAIVQYVGMATDTPPEVIKMMYSTSYTAHMGAKNDFIKSYMKKRRTFERTVMDIAVKEIVKDAIFQGLLDLPGFFDGGWLVQKAYLQGMYLGPVPGHINPLSEVNAEIKAVDAAFKLRSDVASLNGYDFDIMIEEWAEEQGQFTSSPQSFADKISAENVASGADGDNVDETGGNEDA